jgi:hypothetical protein
MAVIGFALLLVAAVIAAAGSFFVAGLAAGCGTALLVAEGAKLKRLLGASGGDADTVEHNDPEVAGGKFRVWLERWAWPVAGGATVAGAVVILAMYWPEPWPVVGPDVRAIACNWHYEADKDQRAVETVEVDLMRSRGRKRTVRFKGAKPLSQTERHHVLEALKSQPWRKIRDRKTGRLRPLIEEWAHDEPRCTLRSYCPPGKELTGGGFLIVHSGGRASETVVVLVPDEERSRHCPTGTRQEAYMKLLAALLECTWRP